MPITRRIAWGALILWAGATASGQRPAPIADQVEVPLLPSGISQRSANLSGELAYLFDDPDGTEALHVIGNVDGCTALLYDDLVDTAGTLSQGASALKDAGARAVYAFATHPVLSGPAVERIADSLFERVIVTDTIPLNEAAAGCPSILVLSVAELFAEAIRRTHEETSISSLFI